MTSPRPQAPRSDAPWDISFLRVGALVTAAVAGVAAVVTGLVAGWAGAVSVLVGAAIVTAFFSVSSLVVAWAGRIDDTFTLPAALGTFLVKALILFAFLSALPDDGWLDVRTLAFSVVAGGDATENVHLAFTATDDETVDRFHAEATAAGYRDNGPPGERPVYHEGYYAAFVLDPDGNNVEVVNHNR